MKYNLISSISLTLLLSVTFIKCDCVVEVRQVKYLEKIERGYYTLTSQKFGHLLKCTDVSINGKNPLKSLLKNGDAEQTNDVRAIHIEKSPMPVVERAIFNSFTNVDKITLLSDDIKELEPNSFADMANLAEITISDNYIKIIESKTFSEIPKLKSLNLHNNEISKLENINQITTLEILNISDNKIRNISKNDFLNLHYLKSLDLSGNYISNIGPNTFANLQNLTDLYLRNNYFKSFSIVPFVKPINKLDISSNFLETIEVESNKTFILYNLDISDNFLEEIKKSQFKNLEKLSSLNLSMNGIKEINVDAFENLDNLTTLSLSENSITTIYIGTFRFLTSLQVLNLSLNAIESFQQGIFTGLEELQILDVSNNRIQKLDLRVFHPGKQIKELYLHGNLLHNVDKYSISGHFNDLERLSLTYKQIGCESLAYSLRRYRTSSIQVKHGDHVKGHNVHGIACDPDIKQIERFDYEEEVFMFVDNFLVLKTMFILVLLITILMFIMKMLSLYNINYEYCRSMFKRRNEDKLVENDV